MYKKILVLDDREVRHEYFKDYYRYRDIDHVYSATECIFFLENYSHEYDIVTLDHDLNGGAYESSDQQNSGYTVAKWLSENKDKQPETILIHSMNEHGAKKMMELLPSAKWVPCHVY